MWTLYKLLFATKSSHISERFKLVQKLETEIGIFPSAVRRCPAVSPGGHEEEAEAGGAL
jgi:hypothetical protein